jgi:nucleotide-binding universal stress UspA family protein
MWKRILVPLDGSTLAELAIPYAEEVAAAFDSEIVLLNVSEPGENQYRHMHQLYLEEIAKQVREHIKGRRPDMVRVVVLPGEPAKQIINYAWRRKIGLIIMTSHGRSGITQWATGSVANKVLNATRVPVSLIKVVKPPQRVPGKPLLNKILLPLDGSKAGEAALPYIRELINRLESEVTLLGVVLAGQHVRTVGGLDFILYPEQYLEVVKTEAMEYLDKVYHRLSGGKAAVKVELKVGDVAREIIKFAEEMNFSLIAISAHGHSGIERWVFGGIAHKVLQASNTSVLLVRTRRGKV